MTVEEFLPVFRRCYVALVGSDAWARGLYEYHFESLFDTIKSCPIEYAERALSDYAGLHQGEGIPHPQDIEALIRKLPPIGPPILPRGVLRLSNISPRAKNLYALLRAYTGKSGYCNPSREQLADHLGISAGRISPLIAELRDALLIKTERTDGTNTYRFLWHPCLDLSRPA